MCSYFLNHYFLTSSANELVILLALPTVIRQQLYFRRIAKSSVPEKPGLGDQYLNIKN